MGLTVVNTIYLVTLVVAGLVLAAVTLTRAAQKPFGYSLVTAAVVIPVAAFFSPLLVVFYAVCFLLVPVLATRAERVAPLYLFAMLMLPEVGENATVAGVYLLELNTGKMVSAGAVVAIWLRTRGQARTSFTTDLPFLVVMLTLGIALSRGATTTAFLRSFVDLIWLCGVPYYVISRSIRTRSDLWLVLVALITAMLVLSVVAGYEAYRGWPLYRAIAGHYGIELTSGASVKLRGGLMRSPGPFSEPTSFAFCLAIGMLAIVYARQVFKSPLHYWLAIGVGTIGLLAPQSRGAWIGVMVGLLAADFVRSDWSALARKVAIGAAGIVAVLTAAGTNARIAELAGLSAAGMGTIDYRKQLLDRGLEEIARKPLFGDSVGAVVYKMRDLTQGEGIVDFVNAYVFVGLIAGLVGLTLLLVAFAAQLGLIWSARKAAVGTKEDTALVGFVFGSVIACYAMFTGTAIGGKTLVMLAILFALGGVVRNIVRSPAPEKSARRPADRPAPLVLSA